MRHPLTRIQYDDRFTVCFAHSVNHLLHRIYHSGHVAHHRHRHYFHLFIHQFLKRSVNIVRKLFHVHASQHQPTLAVYSHYPQFRPSFSTQPLPGQQISVVFHLRHYYRRGFPHQFPNTYCHQVKSFSRISCPNHFFRLSFDI